MTGERAIPHDVMLERATLGAMLLDGLPTICKLRESIGPGDYLTPAHATICGTVYGMAKDGKAVDAATVASEMAAKGLLASVGQGDITEAAGREYLASLLDYANPGALEYNAKALRDKGALRRLMQTGAKLAADAGGPGASPDELVEATQRELYELVQGQGAHGGPVHLADAVTQAIDHADAVHRGEVSPGLATGFPVIDRATGGMQPGDLWTLAAATSAGKTALSLTIAGNVARAGGAVLFVSAEMGARSLANRIIAGFASVDAMRLRIGTLHEQEYSARQAAADSMAQWKLAFLPRAVTAPDVGLTARALAAQWRAPLALIVVDYLQLMIPATGDSRAQQVSGIAWGLKRVAMDIGTPILMLSQLNREGVKADRPPSLYDLKESGDIENHSNAVVLLHKPSGNLMDTDGASIVWARVAKARDGIVTPWPPAQGGIELRFIPRFVRFEPKVRDPFCGSTAP